MQKSELRKKQIAKLKEYAQTSEKQAEDAILLDKLMNLDLIENSQSIGITASLPLEIDTSKIIATLWDEGKDVYLAKAQNDRTHTLNFLHYTYKSILKKSAFGVEEIADPNAEINNELDLIIVPGLAFALDTHARIGFGGGYYDRFLATSESHTVSLANKYMCYTGAAWPIEKTDIPVQTVVTADKIY